MKWREAKSLETLLEQINTAYPNRDKESDGAIGDAAHATRTSDHNPWVVDSSGIHVVTARDFDEDLSANLHSLLPIVNAICRSRDPRVKYIIYEGRITVKGSKLQQWKDYKGVNAHRHHAHISVFPEQKLYDDTRLWSIEAGVPSEPVPANSFYTVEPGDTLWKIAGTFNMPIATIWALNGMKTGESYIRSGQKIRVH
jgi:LysM repeat protein